MTPALSCLFSVACPECKNLYLVGDIEIDIGSMFGLLCTKYCILINYDATV